MYLGSFLKLSKQVAVYLAAVSFFLTVLLYNAFADDIGSPMSESECDAGIVATFDLEKHFQWIHETLILPNFIRIGGASNDSGSQGESKNVPAPSHTNSQEAKDLETLAPSRPSSVISNLLPAGSWNNFELVMAESTDEFLRLSYVTDRGWVAESPQYFSAQFAFTDALSGDASVDRNPYNTVLKANHIIKAPSEVRFPAAGPESAYPVANFGFGGTMEKMEKVGEILPQLSKENFGFQNFFVTTQIGLGIRAPISPSMYFETEWLGGISTVADQTGVAPVPVYDLRLRLNAN